MCRLRNWVEKTWDYYGVDDQVRIFVSLKLIF